MWFGMYIPPSSRFSATMWKVSDIFMMDNAKINSLSDSQSSGVIEPKKSQASNIIINFDILLNLIGGVII